MHLCRHSSQQSHLPRASIYHVIHAAGFTDNATVNVFPSNADGSELLAVTESVKGTYRLDTATLATKYQEHYTDKVKGDLNTAHPKLLPTGESVNIVVGFGTLLHSLCIQLQYGARSCNGTML